MALIGMRGVCWGFGGTPLLEDIDLHIEKGERVGLLGRNGLGKSTVLRLLSGEMTPDAGEVWVQPNTTVAALEQEVPRYQRGKVFDVVASGLGPVGRDIARYRVLTEKPHGEETPGGSMEATEEEIRSLQQKLDAQNGWGLQNQVETIVSLAGLPADEDFSVLSAGMKRRVLFAMAAVSGPNVLLLDEPTNHLDVEAITWMEDYVLQNIRTLVFVTHDRAFLRRVATRIVELERGRAVSWSCDYNTYLTRREAAEEAREKQEAQFDKKLSGEEAWLRQGIKARRKRNQGRVRALLSMRRERENRRKSQGSVNFQVDDSARSGKMVIEAKKICLSFGGQPVIDNFSTRILRGDRIGIIGPNGIGKSTLLDVMLGNTVPDSGAVRHGTGLQVASFDQLRRNLEEDKTVADNIGEGNAFIMIGDRKKHVISHLKDFLFTPERCRTPVNILSGGEKNRLLLARLFARPANVLVLDEPTNDLDIETLELLEEMLFQFAGTVLLVSHDREFVNNVVTSTIVFEAPGRLVEYAGGYDDWMVQRRVGQEQRAKQPEGQGRKERKPEKEPSGDRRKSRSRTGLSFAEKRELESLYEKIPDLESEHEDLCTRLSDPELYRQTGKEDIAVIKNRLQAIEKEIGQAWERWEVLEAIANPEHNRQNQDQEQGR